ncbi:MAG: hemolysin III family protein [Elusimicrobiota bacterium]|jgi:hemolysin III|nr:hemolysin III family protein [Elusimicrobiota bacterium]
MIKLYELKKFFTGKAYTEKEEMLHTLTHWIGTLIVCLGSGCLITLASLSADALKIVSISIYCASMIVLYIASTLYHYAKNAGAKKKLKVFDHSSIYLLIAGTYTPFLLINIQGVLGWAMFVVLWTMALFGVMSEIIFPGRFKKASLIVYIVMGWMVVFAIKPFMETLTLTALIFLLIGGLLYTAGVYFYVRKDKEYYHGVWHIFVLLATIMHYFAVLYGCVLPLAQAGCAW